MGFWWKFFQLRAGSFVKGLENDNLLLPDAIRYHFGGWWVEGYEELATAIQLLQVRLLMTFHPHAILTILPTLQVSANYHLAQLKNKSTEYMLACLYMSGLVLHWVVSLAFDQRSLPESLILIKQRIPVKWVCFAHHRLTLNWNFKFCSGMVKQNSTAKSNSLNNQIFILFYFSEETLWHFSKGFTIEFFIFVPHFISVLLDHYSVWIRFAQCNSQRFHLKNITLVSKKGVWYLKEFSSMPSTFTYILILPKLLQALCPYATISIISLIITWCLWDL